MFEQSADDMSVERKNTFKDFSLFLLVGRIYKMCHYSYLPEEEVVDEMLAILSDRNALIKKKEMEQAQAKINEIYEYGLGVEEEN